MPTTDPSKAHLPIQTERLTIRPFRPDDEAAARDLFRAALDEDLSPDTLSWLSTNPAQLARLTQPPFGDRAVCLNDRPIGMTALVAQPGPFALLENPTATTAPWTMEIGLYWCTHPNHRAKGYAAEAARAMAALAFSITKVPRIIAHTKRDNTSSINVMRRLNMTIHEVNAPDAPWFQVVGTLGEPTLPDHRP